MDFKLVENTLEHNSMIVAEIDGTEVGRLDFNIENDVFQLNNVEVYPSYHSMNIEQQLVYRGFDYARDHQIKVRVKDAKAENIVAQTPALKVQLADV